ncbi:hypothetical protein [Neisseria yangbaofengii]|uniref:hypothetical protein n=1 Tax=Neisseria yangbaofengii TaxID=2709396 RepID=UPI0013EC2D38|nr:hypothetical protein [Neisseria yangbaofengii]
MTEQTIKVIKFILTVIIGVALWWLIKFTIKTWLYPLWNLPSDSDLGSIFAMSISMMIAYRLIYGKA